MIQFPSSFPSQFFPSFSSPQPLLTYFFASWMRRTIFFSFLYSVYSCWKRLLLLKLYSIVFAFETTSANFEDVCFLLLCLPKYFNILHRGKRKKINTKNEIFPLITEHSSTKFSIQSGSFHFFLHSLKDWNWNIGEKGKFLFSKQPEDLYKWSQFLWLS